MMIHYSSKRLLNAFVKILVGMCLMIPAISRGQSDTIKAKSEWLQWQFDLRWGGVYGNSLKTFSNIPKSYRNIPWHPDDDPSHSHFTTIPDSNLNPNSVLSSYYEFSTIFNIKKRVGLKVGLGFFAFGGNISISDPGNSGVIRELDIYTNTYQRGYGTSLVYYAITRKDWVGWKPYFVCEVEVKIAKISDGHLWLQLGGWRKSFSYNIERGWDRYDALQKMDQLSFAKVELTYLYAGLLINFGDYDDPFSGGFLITLGDTFSKVSFTSQAQGTNVQGNSNLMVNIAVDINVPLKTWYKLRTH